MPPDGTSENPFYLALVPPAAPPEPIASTYVSASAKSTDAEPYIELDLTGKRHLRVRWNFGDVPDNEGDSLIDFAGTHDGSVDPIGRFGIHDTIRQLNLDGDSDHPLPVNFQAAVSAHEGNVTSVQAFAW